MYKLIYTQDFSNELRQIEQYIAVDNPLSALLAVRSILSSVLLLQKFPGIWKQYSTSFRMLVENQYKYRIIYRIEERNIYLMWVSKYKYI
jgi:plasmid stabilization system protein ParE